MHYDKNSTTCYKMTRFFGYGFSENEVTDYEFYRKPLKYLGKVLSETDYRAVNNKFGR